MSTEKRTESENSKGDNNENTYDTSYEISNFDELEKLLKDLS